MREKVALVIIMRVEVRLMQTHRLMEAQEAIINNIEDVHSIIMHLEAPKDQVDQEDQLLTRAP